LPIVPERPVTTPGAQTLYSEWYLWIPFEYTTGVLPSIKAELGRSKPLWSGQTFVEIIPNIYITY
jgi:hypothetical protein